MRGPKEKLQAGPSSWAWSRRGEAGSSCVSEAPTRDAACVSGRIAWEQRVAAIAVRPAVGLMTGSEWPNMLVVEKYKNRGKHAPTQYVLSIKGNFPCGQVCAHVWCGRSRAQVCGVSASACLTPRARQRSPVHGSCAPVCPPPRHLSAAACLSPTCVCRLQLSSPIAVCPSPVTTLSPVFTCHLSIFCLQLWW